MKVVLAVLMFASLVGCAATQSEATALQLADLQNTQKQMLQTQLETLKTLKQIQAQQKP
jgi:type IV pilus biogenesis protein CpaD/CtpE